MIGEALVTRQRDTLLSWDVMTVCLWAAAARERWSPRLPPFRCGQRPAAAGNPNIRSLPHDGTRPLFVLEGFASVLLPCCLVLETSYHGRGVGLGMERSLARGARPRNRHHIPSHGPAVVVFSFARHARFFAPVRDESLLVESSEW